MHSIRVKPSIDADDSDNSNDSGDDMLHDFSLIGVSISSACQVILTFTSQLEDSDVDQEDDGTAGAGLDNDEIEDCDWESALPEIEKGSPKKADLARVSKIIYKVCPHPLFIHFSANDRQVSKLAHKIRFSPAAKAAFKTACKEKNVTHPHNVRRNVKTRWNSTELMLEDTERTFDAV
jgi:hypothetical protein